MAYWYWWNGKPSNFLYNDITIDNDLSQGYPVGSYLSEFDSDSSGLSDLYSMNSESLNSTVEKVIINNFQKRF